MKGSTVPRFDRVDVPQDAGKRIAELEAALKLIAGKSEGAVHYLKGSGEMLFLQYAQGCLDTARKALNT